MCNNHHDLCIHWWCSEVCLPILRNNFQVQALVILIDKYDVEKKNTKYKEHGLNIVPTSLKQLMASMQYQSFRQKQHKDYNT